MKLNIQMFADSNITIPKISKKMKLGYAETAYPAESSINWIAYFEDIPQIITEPDSIAYMTLDMEEEMNEQGDPKAGVLKIPVYYLEAQHDKLKEISDSKKNYYWFIQYPPETAITPGKPLVKSFTGTFFLSDNGFKVKDIIKDNVVIYRNSIVTESKGIPMAPVSK